MVKQNEEQTIQTKTTSSENLGKKEKEQKIINSAFHLFGEKGLQKMKMDEVARHADVGKGTLYLYFENKEHLVREMF